MALEEFLIEHKNQNLTIILTAGILNHKKANSE